MVQEFDLTTFLQTPGEVAFVALAVVSDLERHLELREQLFAKFTNSPYVKADILAMLFEMESSIVNTHLNKLSPDDIRTLNHKNLHLKAVKRISAD